MKPHEIATTAVPPSACPSCRQEIAGATGGPGTPTPGAICLCVYCRVVLVFTEDLSLRILTNREWTALPLAQRTELTRLRNGLKALHTTHANTVTTTKTPDPETGR